MVQTLPPHIELQTLLRGGVLLTLVEIDYLVLEFYLFLDYLGEQDRHVPEQIDRHQVHERLKWTVNHVADLSAE